VWRVAIRQWRLGIEKVTWGRAVFVEHERLDAFSLGKVRALPADCTPCITFTVRRVSPSDKSSRAVSR
jgi:hypothetical protein